MATRADPSPLEQLRALLAERAGPARQWRESLPTLRAKTAATSAVLDGLAQTWPGSPPPRHEYVDVLLAAPSREWAEAVVTGLRETLPSEAQVDLLAGLEPLRDAPAPSGFTVRCQVFMKGISQAAATGVVRTALTDMGDVDVDYSESLDLVVVSPRV